MATRRQRIDSKVASGMDHIMAEKAVIKEDFAVKKAKLIAKEKKEHACVNKKALDILSKKWPYVWGEVMTEARMAVDNRRRARSDAAKKGWSACQSDMISDDQ